jgi:tetratricopeptide (TPR) repeat protein
LQLDVAVEGSVLLEDNRVRVDVRLIDALNDRHLWAHTYDRDLRDVLIMQSEMAVSIAHQIEVRLSPTAETRLSNTQPIHPEAHAAYLKGRYYWHQFFTEAGMRTAIDYFQHAIELEPRYAQAWAHLAACYIGMAVQAMLPPAEAESEGKKAAQQALALDPISAIAHVVMAAVHLFFDWNWPAVERAIQSALELSSNSEVHGLFTHYALARGWGEQAVASQRRALDLDPLSATMNTDLAWAHLLNRDYKKALEVGLSTQRMKFSYPLTQVYICQAYLCLGQYEEAITEIEKIVPPDEDAPGPLLAMIGHAYGVAHRREAARAVISRMEDLSRRCYVASYDWAVVFAGWGDKQIALQRLERAFDDREPRVIWLNVEPAFDSIREDKAFQKLVERLQLT